MFILSRKTKVSVERRVNEVFEGRFTESTVKELMIDLRELALEILTGKGADPKFDQYFIQFVEICNFIAHSNREKGVIEDNVRNHAERIADALLQGGDHDWSELMAVRDIVNGDAIVAGMLGTAFSFLSSFNKSLEKDFMTPAFLRKDELSLCIISLLQDATIQLKKGRGRAFLHVLVHEGHYRLYCLIFSSRVHTDAQKRTNGSGRVVLGFPVIMTGAKDIDGILALRTRGTFVPVEEDLPKIIETYRETDGLLHVRLLNEACSAE